MGRKVWWTDERKEFVRNNLNHMKMTQIANLLGTSRASVSMMVKREGWTNKNYNYSKVEIDYLKTNYGILTLEVMAKELGRSKTAIFNKIKELDLEPIKAVWDEFDITFLKKNILYHSASWIAERLGRTEQAVVAYAIRLGYKAKDFNSVKSPTLKIVSHQHLLNISKKAAKVKVEVNSNHNGRRSNRPWSIEEDEIILRTNLSNAEIAIKIERSEIAVAVRRCNLKKKK